MHLPINPQPEDRCAVAVNMAARVAWESQRAWYRETGYEVPAWADIDNTARLNYVDFAIRLVQNPDEGAAEAHEYVFDTEVNTLPSGVRRPFEDCPVAYRVSLSLAVAAIRAVTDNLVSARQMRQYIQQLEDGTDPFMSETHH